MPSRYTSTYEKLFKDGPDTRPTALQIIADEGLEGKWTDKTVLITGTASGIGIETARAIAATGATVFCTARNLSKAETALSSILKPGGKVHLLEMDQNSLASVKSAAAEFLSRSNNKLNVLICNAGIMAVPTIEKTADGHESQFGVNHLSHFLLFNLVKDALLSSSTPTFNSRVVMVSSSGHRRGEPQYGNYNFDSPTGTKYSPWLGYGQAKTSNIYMANYIDRVYGPQGIHATSLHPGGIATGLQVHIKDMMDAAMKDPKTARYMKTPEQGAATQVWAAVSKDWEGTGGKFLEDCDISPPVADAETGTNRGYAPHAYNPEGEDRLWKDSVKIVGL